MRVPSGRRSAVVVVVLATTLILALVGPATAVAKAPKGLQRFMNAIGQVESGGNYYARNRHSGAYGKYQIMPSNWPSWAGRYLGNSRARPTPANQELVARGKFTALYRKVGSWRQVAHWWLTGSSRRSGWSASTTRYVNKVMRNYRLGIGGKHVVSSSRHIGETSKLVAYSGGWKSARFGAYAGNAVRYASAAGATATVTFTGHRIRWYGPSGPTRGKAQIWIDGRYVKTVDLHQGSFKARTIPFKASWSNAGKHTLTIKVVGGGRHPMVAIDEFVVTP